MNKWLSLSVGLSVLALVGCHQPASKSTAGGVAVIDLDRVAKAVGWMDELSQNLQAAETELRGQLDQLYRNSLKSLEDTKNQIATDAKLTPEQTRLLTSAKDARDIDSLPLNNQQRDALAAAAGKANTAWQTALNNYQQTLQARRTSLIMSYRDKVRPLARRVAAARGFNAVLIASDNLLYYDPESSDITDQVIDEIQKTLPAKQPAKAESTPAPTPSAAPAN